MTTLKQYFSNRGLPLVYYGPFPQQPLITVENYMKWYSIYLVTPEGTVKVVEFMTVEDDLLDVSFSTKRSISIVGDHCINPDAVEAWAQKKGYEVDGNSLEMMIGRWETEHG